MLHHMPADSLCGLLCGAEATVDSEGQPKNCNVIIDGHVACCHQCAEPMQKQNTVKQTYVL